MSPRAAGSAGAARRAARGARWEALFDPRDLALGGALVSLAFLFQPLMPLKAALLAAFLAAALLSGKRVSLPAGLSVTLGVVAANLLVPVGRVLFRVGPLPVTETALLEGLDKAMTFEGLVFVSKACVRPGLRLPGRFGEVVAAAFVYYDRIVEYRGRVRPASFMRDADELMLAVWERGTGDTAAGGASAAAAAPPPRVARSGKGTAIVAVAASISLAALAAGIIARRP